MNRRLIALTAVALLALATGCGGSETTPSPTPFSNVPQDTDATTPPSDEDSTSALTQDTPPSGQQAVCSLNPPIGPQVENLPPVTGEDWIRGAPDAPVTMIEYSDYQ